MKHIMKFPFLATRSGVTIHMLPGPHLHEACLKGLSGHRPLWHSACLSLLPNVVLLLPGIQSHHPEPLEKHYSFPQPQCCKHQCQWQGRKSMGGCSVMVLQLFPLLLLLQVLLVVMGHRLPLLFILPGLSEVPFGTWLIWIQHLHMSMKMMTSSKLLNGKLPTMFSCRRRLRHQTSQCIPRGLQVPVFLDTWYSLFWNWTKTDDWQWVIIFSRVRLNHELPSPLLY